MYNQINKLKAQIRVKLVLKICKDVFETNRVESKDKSVINTQNLKHVFETNQDLMKMKDVTSTEQHQSTMAIFDNRNESISYDINDNFDNASAVEFDVGLPSSKDSEMQRFDTEEQVNATEGMNLQFPFSANDPEFDNDITQEFKSVMKEKARKMISDENGLKSLIRLSRKQQDTLLR